MQAPKTDDELMLTSTAAALIGVAAQTMYIWRTQGRGPKYSTIPSGKSVIHLYARSDLEAFMTERPQRLAVAK